MLERDAHTQAVLAKMREVKKAMGRRFPDSLRVRYEAIESVLTSQQTSLCFFCQGLKPIHTVGGVDIQCDINPHNNPIELYKNRPAVYSKPDCKDFKRLPE